MIRDKNVEWLEKRIYLPVETFTGVAAAGFRGTGAAVTADVQANITGGPGPDAVELVTVDAVAIYPMPGYSLGTGNPELVRINVASGPKALLMSTAGDDVRTWLMLPYDIDRSKQIRVRVHWTSAAAAVGARTINWLVLYSALAEDGTIVAPATALNTVVPQDTPTGTAHQWQATDFGVITKNTLVAGALALGLLVEMDAFDAAFTENKYLLGLEVRYTPRKMSGPEKNLRGGRRLATASPLGVALHATQEG